MQCVKLTSLLHIKEKKKEKKKKKKIRKKGGWGEGRGMTDKWHEKEGMRLFIKSFSMIYIYGEGGGGRAFHSSYKCAFIVPASVQKHHNKIKKSWA